MKTALTTRFAIDHPIIQAGMGWDCGVEIAAAVSNAGALGTIGSIGRTADDLEQVLVRMKEATNRPWSVNIVSFDWDPVLRSRLVDSHLDLAIEAQPPSITISFGDPLPALERCLAAGIPAIVQVQDFATACAVLAARPAAIVVQGNEAGGHTGRRGILSFAAQVLDEAGDIPVVVAGGVATGRGLAAALAMGASGVLMGTRFKVTPEYGSPNTGLLEEQRAAIVQSNGDNTVWDEVNDVADIAQGMKWPRPIAGRVLANHFTAKWVGHEDALRKEVAGQEEMFGWTVANNNSVETVLNWAGEASGLIHEVLPAAEVVARTAAEAEKLLRDATRISEPAPAGRDSAVAGGTT